MSSDGLSVTKQRGVFQAIIELEVEKELALLLPSPTAGFEPGTVAVSASTKCLSVELRFVHPTHRTLRKERSVTPRQANGFSPIKRRIIRSAIGREAEQQAVGDETLSADRRRTSRLALCESGEDSFDGVGKSALASINDRARSKGRKDKPDRSISQSSGLITKSAPI